MADSATFRQLALSFPDTSEEPHFDRASFRIKKKIFATLQEKAGIGMVALTPVDQSVYCAIDKAAIYPVPGGWGLKGATYINLEKVKKPILKEILGVAYNTLIAKTAKKK